MSEFISSPSGISRRAVTVTAALLILGAAIVFRVRCGASNNTICQKWETREGVTKAYMTSSGSLALSGTLLVKGNISGATILINGAPAGQTLCKLASGAIGQCTSVVGVGGGCTCS